MFYEGKEQEAEEKLKKVDNRKSLICVERSVRGPAEQITFKLNSERCERARHVVKTCAGPRISCLDIKIKPVARASKARVVQIEVLV